MIWEVNKANANDAKYFLREFALDEEVDNTACQARYANLARFDERFVCTTNLFNNQFAVIHTFDTVFENHPKCRI